MKQKNDIIETEVLKVFYPAFTKAMTECWMEQREMKIISEISTEHNSYLIKVKAKNPCDFYYLGAKYGTYKAKI